MGVRARCGAWGSVTRGMGVVNAMGTRGGGCLFRGGRGACRGMGGCGREGGGESPPSLPPGGGGSIPPSPGRACGVADVLRSASGVRGSCLAPPRVAPLPPARRPTGPASPTVRFALAAFLLRKDFSGIRSEAGRGPSSESAYKSSGTACPNGPLQSESWGPFGQAGPLLRVVGARKSRCGAGRRPVRLLKPGAEWLLAGPVVPTGRGQGCPRGGVGGRGAAAGGEEQGSRPRPGPPRPRRTDTTTPVTAGEGGAGPPPGPPATPPADAKQGELPLSAISPVWPLTLWARA